MNLALNSTENQNKNYEKWARKKRDEVYNLANKIQQSEDLLFQQRTFRNEGVLDIVGRFVKDVDRKIYDMEKTINLLNNKSKARDINRKNEDYYKRNPNGISILNEVGDDVFKLIKEFMGIGNNYQPRYFKIDRPIKITYNVKFKNSTKTFKHLVKIRKRTPKYLVEDSRLKIKKDTVSEYILFDSNIWGDISVYRYNTRLSERLIKIRPNFHTSIFYPQFSRISQIIVLSIEPERIGFIKKKKIVSRKKTK